MTDIRKDIDELLEIHRETLHEVGRLRAELLCKDNEIECLKRSK